MTSCGLFDVEATPTQISNEVESTETIVERPDQRFDLKPM